MVNRGLKNQSPFFEERTRCAGTMRNKQKAFTLHHEKGLHSTMHTFSYLALGDSYTIGEGVPLHDSFPYQTVSRLRKTGLHFHAPEILAKTGWTTDELQDQLSTTPLLLYYDFVSLLIGVNNQYRGRSIIEYGEQFEYLLRQSIKFTDNHPSKVIVLSIPDWGVTPFAAKGDSAKISAEINAFNKINQSIAKQHKVNYVDITLSTREAAADYTLLAADKLHYSRIEHGIWADQVCALIKSIVNRH